MSEDGARACAERIAEALSAMEVTTQEGQLYVATEIIRAYRDREVAEALAEQAVRIEQLRAPALANIESADDWDGTPCEVCGQPCLYGSRHPDCYDKLKQAEARVAEQAREIERLTLGLRRIISDAEQCAAWAKDEQRGRQVAQFETLAGIARAALGAASGQEGGGTPGGAECPKCGAYYTGREASDRIKCVICRTSLIKAEASEQGASGAGRATGWRDRRGRERPGRSAA